MQEILFRSTGTTYYLPFPFIPSGTIVILFQRGEAAVVRYEEPTGRVRYPTFIHPSNVIALLPEAMEAVSAFCPDIKLCKRSRVFICPTELAAQADWSGFDPEWVSRFHRGQKVTVFPLYFGGMMDPQGRYSQQMLDAAQLLNVDVNLLPLEGAAEIRFAVEERFGDVNQEYVEQDLCWRLREPYQSLSWDFDQQIDISGLVGDDSVLFFIDYMSSPEEVFNVLEISDGKKAIALAGECGFFTFYITNSKFDYLLSHSDEQCLFAAGSAVPWFEKTFLQSS